MNIEEINKWLDNEYGVSYTRLEELHDFFFEKYTNLNCILTELEEWLKEQGDNGIDEWGNHYTICLYKLNKLKEKYK